MTDDCFRILSHNAKAEKVTCRSFLHGNQNCPPSLSQKGRLHSGIQPQLFGILEQGTNTKYGQPNVDTDDG